MEGLRSLEGERRVEELGRLLDDRRAVDKFLHAEASDGEHCHAPMLDLSQVHVGPFLAQLELSTTARREALTQRAVQTHDRTRARVGSARAAAEWFATGAAPREKRPCHRAPGQSRGRQARSRWA
eukprot:1612665-Prymnesium_polylepis.1